MASSLANKVVVVTGGSRGIGKGLVDQLVAKGSRVVATARQPADAADLQELAQRHPHNLTVLPLDTRDAASVMEFGRQVRALTLEHVDVLINNAGVYGRGVRSILEVDSEDFQLPFATNAVGPFLCTQALLREGLIGRAPPAADAGAAAGPIAGPTPPGSSALRSSLVVNISSVMASHGDQLVSSRTGGGYAYRASKAALNIMSKAMAMDLAAWSIEVVCMHPGYCRTDMTGGEGWVGVEESAAGMLRVLEDGRPLHGRFIGYDGAEIPW